VRAEANSSQELLIKMIVTRLINDPGTPESAVHVSLFKTVKVGLGICKTTTLVHLTE
jgi:hypothetical protein